MNESIASNIKTVAVIGCGRSAPGKVGWAQGHTNARGMLAAFPDARLCGVDIDPDNLRGFGDTFGLPEENLFSSTEALYAAVTPDIVAIATWPKLHCPQVHEAAWRGVKGILCEKPLATDNSEIDRMMQVCAKKGVKFAVAHQRRHEPKFQTVRRLIEEGRFGDKIVLHARLGDDWDILSWTVHWFDMANYLFGGRPDWILAGIHHDGERRYQHAVESASVIFAEYSTARQAIFTTGPAPLIDHGFMIADLHHPDPDTGRTTRDGLLTALEALGHVTHLVAVDEQEVNANDLQDCEALLICHTVLKSSETTRRLVGEWIFSGKPTVIVHCGIGAWPDWTEWRQATGRYWVWPETLHAEDAGRRPSGHPFVPCEIEVCEVSKFHTGWTHAWLPVDEVYCDLAEGESIEWLARTKLDDAETPIAWRNAERPNITAWLPGHRADIWELPIMRVGLQAVLNLACQA